MAQITSIGTVKGGKMGQFSTSAMYFHMKYIFLKSTKNTVTSSYIVLAISTGKMIKIHKSRPSQIMTNKMRSYFMKKGKIVFYVNKILNCGGLQSLDIIYVKDDFSFFHIMVFYLS